MYWYIVWTLEEWYIIILPKIIWSDNEFRLNFVSTNCINTPCVLNFAFLDFFKLNEVINVYRSILNFVFSNNNCIIVNTTLNPFVPNDQYHPTLDICILLQDIPDSIDSTHSFYNFCHVDYHKIFVFKNASVFLFI